MAERELNRSERAAIRKLVTELCANYDSQDKICLPLDSPCYMLNKWWTGAYCRYFEKAAWPSGGEIDIMERLNNDSIAYQTVHSHYTYTLGITENPKSHSTGPIYPDRYNVYAVEMYPDSLSFYINDMHTFTYPRIQTKEEGQYPFNQPFYLLIDMQLGGSWVGAVGPEDLPVEMEVDWVHFYQRKSKK